MDAKGERRFLLAAGLLVLASWVLLGWGLWAKRHQLYHNQFEDARVVRRLPDARYLVRFERTQGVRSLPAAGGAAQLSPGAQADRLPDGSYLVPLLEETAEVEIPDLIARQLTPLSTVRVKRREYLGGFKTAWRAIECAPF